MKSKGKTGPAAVTGSRKARLQAAIVLEVLSGMRSPSDAASAMGVAVNRYYQLETRAMQGVVDALEPRPRGRQKSPEDEIVELKQQNEKLKQEVSRCNALLRSTQRSLGVPAPKKQPKTVTTSKGRKRRRRKPAVRALKHVAHLKEGTDTDAGPGEHTQPSDSQSSSKTTVGTSSTTSKAARGETP